MQKETFAFVAATPLQVMHCTEFVGNDLEGSAGKSDLYIVHSFGTADKISEGVKKSGIFNHVYDLMPRVRKNKLQSKLATFYDLFFSRQALQKKSCGETLDLEKKAYEYVLASSPTTFTIGMRLVYPKAKVYLYDDGIGSYYGSMAHDYNSKLLQAMNRLFFRGKLILEPEAMYLTLPELCRNTLSCPRHILPTLPEEKLAILDRIFDYQMNSVYEEHRMVYLTQPFEEIPDISIETEPALLRLLEKYSKDTVVRVHPRQKDAQFGHLMRDPYENLWEMECLRQLTDRNVLISFCSTAQFMPKMLGSTQPYLIFLYRLFGKELSGTMTEVLQEFTRQYSKPDRIFIPETLEELEQLLERLMGPCEAL